MASGVGVILFSLSFGCQKIGSPCGSFGPCLRSSAVIVRCSPLQRRPKRLSQQNWGGRMRARWWWWWFSVLSLFFVFTSLRAVHSPSLLGLAGVLELAMRLSYLRAVLSFVRKILDPIFKNGKNGLLKLEKKTTKMAS